MPTANRSASSTKSYTDQNLDKELRGNATREPQGVKIQIDKPETKSFDLQPTQFPTQHLVDLINRAKTGETFYETSIFDGSEDADKAMTTTVVVGKPANATQQRSGAEGAATRSAPKNSGRSTSPISTRRRKAARTRRNTASASSSTRTG